jgi:hypothetical protein
MFSSFTRFGQNDHLQKDIINTYGNYYYHVTDIKIYRKEYPGIFPSISILTTYLNDFSHILVRPLGR